MPADPHSGSKVWKAPDREIGKPGENREKPALGAPLYLPVGGTIHQEYPLESSRLQRFLA